MVICLERDADLHMAQLMPLSLTVSCFSKIQLGFTFLVPAHPGSPGQGAVCVCVCACVCGMPHAMSTIRHQSVQSLAFHQAEWIPMMADCTSASSYLASLRMVFPIAARLSLNACCTDTVTALSLLVR